MERIGVIGGSGMYEMLENPSMFIHNNQFGRSTEIFEGKVGERTVYFLPRHGPDHTIIVPRIPYRANIWAMKELGVKRIIATNSVGSINASIGIGDMVIPDDYINFTSRMPRSFYDDIPIAYHVDMSPPYCPVIRESLIKAAKMVYDGPTHESATIVIIEGLSFSSPAEQRLFQQWGADLVGMTTMPEAVLAREAAMCYAHICMPTDCIGEPIKADVFQRHLREGVQKFIEIITRAIEILDETHVCKCGNSLDHAILAKL
jgi:5'-methylthioadenosine phosphorylase